MNFTPNDYLVALWASGKVILVRYLESGDSLALGRRYDDCKIQVKIIETAPRDVDAATWMQEKWGATYDAK